MNAAEYRTNCLLDLDAGDFVPPPLALNLTNRETIWFWAAAAGVDVAGTVTPAASARSTSDAPPLRDQISAHHVRANSKTPLGVSEGSLG